MAQPQGLTAAEKARVREGWQCPGCFGPWVETQSRGAFEPWSFKCLDCGEVWDAADPRYQGSART